MCEAVEKFAREYCLDQFNKGVSEGRVEGRDEGLLESVRNVMKNLKMSSEQAMQSLGIPESDYPKYLSRL